MYFVEKNRKLDILKCFDYPLFFAVIILSALGAFVLSSATLTISDGGIRIMTVQIIGLLVGVAISIILSIIDYKDFKIIGVGIFIVSVALLILVLAIGTGEELGSRSWLKIGSFSFQPSEIAKIGFIAVVSIFLERIYDKTGNTRMNVVKLIIVSSIPIVLVLAQKDFGTTMVFLFIFMLMLFIYGIKYKHILYMIITFISTTPFLWFFVLNDKRKDRIRVFLNPELDPLGSGFNVLRSKMAIGSGQILGKGIYQGIQTQNSTVPVKESDFIFSVIGEELGFAGAVIFIVLITFILIRCIYISSSSRDTYGSFLVIGVVAMFGMHFVENIGMSIGLLPVTGIPLPFTSAGGSAMISNYIALGIVLSVSMRRNKGFLSDAYHC